MTRLLGLLAVVAVAGPGFAQEPDDDEPLKQAQFTEPIPASPATPSGLPRGLPALPPTPVVQVIVLAPRDAHGEKEIEYTVRVVNTSTVRANAVRVWVPWPDAADNLLNPEPKTAVTSGKPVVWELGSLDPNSTQTLTFAVKPMAGKAELAVRAYVRFDHGQQVVTRLSAPKLLLKADAPKQASADGPVPVRLTVSNPGRVPAVETKLTVTVSPGFEFTKEDGGEPTKEKNQRVWEVGSLLPGQTRTLPLKVRPADGRELLLTAAANSSNTAADQAEVKVKVLESGLKLTLDGDPKAASGVAGYRAVVRNTGGLPLTNVRLTGGIPDDCRAAGHTDGGRRTPTAIVWVIPKLAADEEYEVRWKLEGSGTGTRTVRAAVVAGTLEDKASVQTLFQGSPNLTWKQKFDQSTVGVDRQGMLTVEVSNSGSEPAADVRLTIDLPDGVTDIESTPKATRQGRQLVFPAETIGAGKVQAFTLSFRGETAGPAYFDMQLAAEALGGQPLKASKSVEVTGRR